MMGFSGLRVEKSDAIQGRGKRARVKLGTMAVCLCLAAIPISLFGCVAEEGGAVARWTPEWEAEDYFSSCDAGSDVVMTTFSFYGAEYHQAVEGYVEEREFSDWRERLEADGAIPAIDSYPLFDCRVRYDVDGGISSVTMSWHRRGEMTDYSDLEILAGRQEVKRVEDSQAVECDENGDPIEPRVTVTERDGMRLVAEGAENREKSLTFENDSGWYRVSGSFNNSYESVVELLDWIWEHPLDFSLFSMEAGES